MSDIETKKLSSVGENKWGYIDINNNVWTNYILDNIFWVSQKEMNLNHARWWESASNVQTGMYVS